MNNKSLIISFIVIIVLAGIGFYLLKSPRAPETPEAPTGDYSDITSFRDCVDAGFSVTQSLPHQCKTPDGRIFVEGVDNPTAAKATGGCYIGGCSSQICSDQPDVVTSCEYKSEYTCYQTAVCERQVEGGCGWRQSPDVGSCLEFASQAK